LYPTLLIGRTARTCVLPTQPKSHRLVRSFRPLGARASVQPIERTKLSLDRGCGGRGHHASFIGTGAALSFPSTKIAWNCLACTASNAMNLINLDIRMLRSLMSVVETGSITETARRLGRTQPAITLQLQRLEELTGKAIFIHEGRRLFLTAEGETVLSYARSIIGF